MDTNLTGAGMGGRDGWKVLANSSEVGGLTKGGIS